MKMELKNNMRRWFSEEIHKIDECWTKYDGALLLVQDKERVQNCFECFQWRTVEAYQYFNLFWILL